MLPGSPAIVAGCDDPRGILCQYVKDNSTGTQGLEGKPYPRPRDWKYSGGQIKVFDGRILRTCRHIVDGGNGIGSAIDVLKTGKLQGVNRTIVPLKHGVHRLVESSLAKPTMTPNGIQPYHFSDIKPKSPSR
ncbi:hypothetical protein CGCF415_v005009 [Colletotrichum fructicola]|nr:hypothetical protein CGCF415_v005009 [Colletotrichum fructicola]KAF4938968.1 hypothetical protein CGCF245_v003981 [Colletotrichum fructicola]